MKRYSIGCTKRNGLGISVFSVNAESPEEAIEKFLSDKNKEDYDEVFATYISSEFAQWHNSDLENK